MDTNITLLKTNYKGILEILNKMIASGVYKNLSKHGIERPGLFADIFRDTCCSKSTGIPEDIINEIEAIMKCLTKSSLTKNYLTQIESVLFALAGLSCTQASTKLQILSVLIKEAAEIVACCDQVPKEPPARIQTKTLLNLVSNFIREWGERPGETRSHLKICKFCDSIINDKTRQYARKYCCVEAEYLDRLSKEWLSSHDTSKLDSAVSTDTEYEVNYSSKSVSQKEYFARIQNCNNTELRLIATGQDDTQMIFKNRYRNHSGFWMNTDPSTSTKAYDEHQRNVPDASREIDSRRIGHTIGSDIETSRRDGIADEDLSEANGSRSLRRGKTETSAGKARSNDSTRNTDTVVERIREKRDNNPHQRELGEVEDKNQQDRRSAQRDVQEEANRSQIAAENRRGGRDTEDAMAEEEEEKKEKEEEEKSGGERGNPDKNPYQQRRGEERETRLPDNSARKIGRLDRAEEKGVTIEIPRKPAKRLERDESIRHDRRENEENSVARRDRKKEEGYKNEEADTALLSKNKEPGSKRTTDSLGDAEMGRPAVNEEEKLPLQVSNGKRKGGASNDRRYDHEEARKRTSRKFLFHIDPIEYQLSNTHFVELGWTRMPVAKIMREIVRYEARPAKPGLDWFKKYRHRGTKYYDDGLTLFSRFHSDGSGELFYPNGVLAVRVYRPENRKYDMYTVFTPGGKDALAIERESQILAIFDSMGYGVVFDVDGVARLSYNQIGGIFTDNPAGLPLIWVWNANPRESILETVYTENLSDRLQMEFFPPTNKSAESSGNVKTPISPSSSRNKEKKVAEVQKPVVEERQEDVGSKSNGNQAFPNEDIYHIKVICMKLNEFFGLRVIDRRNISLRFSARNKSIRIELGTIVNFNKEVASCMVEASDWKSDMLKCRFQEKLSKKLESESSLYDLAKEYRKVKRFAKERKVMIAKYKPFSEISRTF